MLDLDKKDFEPESAVKLALEDKETLGKLLENLLSKKDMTPQVEE